MSEASEPAPAPVAATQDGAPADEPAVATILPGWGPYVLGAIFIVQILVIAIAGVTGLRFGEEVRASQQAAVAAAEKARVYAAYAECLAAAQTAPDAPACVKPAD